MEGIEKYFLSPWICELACMHISVETEVPGVRQISLTSSSSRYILDFQMGENTSIYVIAQ